MKIFLKGPIFKKFEEAEFRKFNKEEVEKLRSFLNSLSTSSGSCSLAQSDKCLVSNSLNVDTLPHSFFWILDSGATDHMPIAYLDWRPTNHAQEIKQLPLLMVSLLT